MQDTVAGGLRPPQVTLRPYQEECVDAVMSARDRGLNRVLYVQATGTGKSYVAAEITRRLRLGDDRPSLILAHRDELLHQLGTSMRTVMGRGVTIRREQGENTAQEDVDIICASIPTIGRKGNKRLAWLEDVGPSCIFLDEAHHSSFVPGQTYYNTLERFGAFDGSTFLFGCTATPHRMDQHALVGPHGEATFEEQVFQYDLLQAIREGHLCPVKGFKVVTDTDISRIGSQAGDFKQGDLEKAVDTEHRTQEAIKHWKEIAGDRVTAVFCVGVEHAENVAEEFNKAGVKAGFVTGSTDVNKRRDILRDWRNGNLQVVCNVGVLTEGFDFPQISCVLMLRPTQSWSLYTQMVGRGTRNAPNKTGLYVIDVVDVTSKHNLATCPAMIGLPAKLDMKGGSLLEAKEEMDEAIKEGSYNPKARTLKEIKTRLESVDLLGMAQSPPEVQEHSRLSWLLAGEGYLLSGGKFPDGTHRVAYIKPDALGTWTCRASQMQGGWKEWRVGKGDYPNFENADRAVEMAWPQSRGLISQDVAWKKEGATEKQLNFLARFHSPEFLATISKGQASALIAQRINAPKTGGRRR